MAAACNASRGPVPELGARAGGRVSGGTPLVGKYRSELEAAIQHALALELPGASYAMAEAGLCSTFRAGRASGPRRERVTIAASLEHICAFRALWRSLKKRSFRQESQFIQWV